jgi:hypothetical protein
MKITRNYNKKKGPLSFPLLYDPESAAAAESQMSIAG